MMSYYNRFLYYMFAYNQTISCFVIFFVLRFDQERTEYRIKSRIKSWFKYRIKSWIKSRIKSWINHWFKYRIK